MPFCNPVELRDGADPCTEGRSSRDACRNVLRGGTSLNCCPTWTRSLGIDQVAKLRRYVAQAMTHREQLLSHEAKLQQATGIRCGRLADLDKLGGHCA